MLLRDTSRGYSFVEVVFVAGLVATMSGVAIPQVLSMLEDLRTAGAARYMAGCLQRARMEAIKRSAEVALQFAPGNEGYGFAMYLDGDGNGVRTPDIVSGVDRRLGPVDRLADKFPGVDFGALAGLPAVDPGSQPPRGEPVRLGASRMASFAAIGTASSGSLYIRGRRTAQYVVRLYGDTGKIRVLKFDSRSKKWKPA